MSSRKATLAGAGGIAAASILATAAILLSGDTPPEVDGSGSGLTAELVCLPASPGVYKIANCSDPSDTRVQYASKALPSLSEPLRRAQKHCAASSLMYDPKDRIDCEYVVERAPETGEWGMNGIETVLRPNLPDLRIGVDVSRDALIRFNHGVRVIVEDGVTPFFVRGFGDASGSGRGAGGVLEIRGGSFISRGNDQSEYTAGVFAEGRPRIHRSYFYGFTHGIRIDAGARRGKPELRSNANTWRLDDVEVQHARHAALWIDGPDANAGLAVGFQSTWACRAGVRWTQKIGPCAAIYDSSFLGNTYIGSVIHVTRDYQNGVTYPSVVTDNINAAATVVGTYAESDPMRFASSFALKLGGMSRTSTGSRGSAWEYGAVNRLVAENTDLAGNRVRIGLGDNAATEGSVFEVLLSHNGVCGRLPGWWTWHKDENGQIQCDEWTRVGALGLRYDPRSKRFKLDYARAGQSLTIDADADADTRGRPRLWNLEQCTGRGCAP